MAEWSTSRTRNPAVPGSSPALTTTWFCFSVALKSSVTLLNSQLVCLRPVGILSTVNYIQFELFVSVVCSAPLALLLINTAESK